MRTQGIIRYRSEHRWLRACPRECWAIAAGACSLALSASAFGAASQTLVADIRGAQETPPNGSAGRGCGRFEIDTNANTLKFHISYHGLGAAETAAQSAPRKTAPKEKKKSLTGRAKATSFAAP